MSHFLDRLPGTLVCGHRGHSIDGHENSIEALDLAAKYGADICEIDLRRSADGVMAVFHDMVLNETSTGDGAVADHAWETLSGFRHRLRGSAETGAPLSRVEEILDHAKTIGMNLVIELKDTFDDRELKALFALIDERQMWDAVMISSFDHPYLLNLKGLDEDIRTLGIVHAHLIDAVGLARGAAFSGLTLDYPKSSLDTAPALTRAGIAPSHLLRPREHYRQAGESGIAEVAKVIEVIQNGDLKILFCDDVAWAVEVRDAEDAASLGLSGARELEEAGA